MIIWLASYPRSGNTLLRILLQRAFGLSTWSLYNDEGDIAKDQDFADLVGHRAYDGNADKFVETARASGDLYLIKTHGAPGDGEKAIYILREGRASVVSFYHYLKNHSPLNYHMDDVIAGAVPHGGWSEHVKAWDPLNRPDTLFLKFEDLRDAPGPAIDKISEFLNISRIGDGEISFEELQQVAPNFFRSGNNDKNNAELSEDQTALFDRLHGDIAVQFDYPASERADAALLGEKLAEQAARYLSSRQFEFLAESLRERLKEQAGELSTLRENLKFRRARIERTEIERDQAVAHAQVLSEEQLQARREIAVLSEKQLRARREVAVLSEKQLQARCEFAALSEERETLFSQLAKSQNRLAHLEYILAPRLKSIATLRPLRYVMRERNRLKKQSARPDVVPETVGVPDGVPDTSNHQASPEFIPTMPAGKAHWPALGIAVFGFTRADNIRNVLESLARQDALHITHVFLDGDQGRPDIKRQIDQVYDVVSAYPVKQVHRQRGAFGFRKMMLIAGKFMQAHYERMLFLEDDCFPVDGAVAEFNRELDIVEDDDNIFSVYGHPFLVEGEVDTFPRFQGWGWATTRAKLAPVWRELEKCYLMSEPDYLSFVSEKLTDEIVGRIDVTPGRQPTSTLRKFFAWDETVCLLTALKGQCHKPSDRRLIYNCGAGLESSHFKNLIEFRRPPFNMIGEDEVWRYFQP